MVLAELSLCKLVVLVDFVNATAGARRAFSPLLLLPRILRQLLLCEHLIGGVDLDELRFADAAGGTEVLDLVPDKPGDEFGVNLPVILLLIGVAPEGFVEDADDRQIRESFVKAAPCTGGDGEQHEKEEGAACDDATEFHTIQLPEAEEVGGGGDADRPYLPVGEAAGEFGYPDAEEPADTAKRG